MFILNIQRKPTVITIDLTESSEPFLFGFEILTYGPNENEEGRLMFQRP